MARKRKGEKVDGWMVVDKPLGMSSAKVVGRIKYLTKAQKVGHGGTLDPLASGILPIGLGEATKTMPFIVDASKDYAFTVRFGSSTDSDDLEGAVLESGGRIPQESEVVAILPRFTGTIEQVPPAYSAIKVDGQRAYKLARDGETVELRARPVKIHTLRLDSFDTEAGEATLFVTCGKGTYVRSLARDIALALGTFGHVSMLRRLRVGPFGLERAISLEKLDELSHSAPAVDYLCPIATALDDIPAVAVSDPEADRIRCGQTLHLPAAKQGTIVLMCGDVPLAVAENTDGIIKSLRVFNM
ncbi:tRNA pseudouridine(55) synthase TruB [Kordiimonas aestuarii]|uniref:tRNA pseudouridine(55) synthase TruB n=1 Tax=Kordiimonas aestuarii TaxID=1005925 RepID=UPI0021CF8B82|nr:tRNA pseudouridine(55) synthase TruB [Kordiimonas aestuarii]